MKIFLIGYRCTGKTTLGKILAHRLNFDFIDTDRLIEQHLGSTILEIIENQGWKKFRQIEKQILLNTKKNKNTIIATGGGIIIDHDNQQFIKKNGFCVWLDADIKTIMDRLNIDNKTRTLRRPPLTNKDLFAETNEILKKRKPLYEKTAQIRIDVSFHTPEEIVNIIDRRLKDVRQ
ncbi:MAG: shikimate kinase AroL [Proteobacteria bacterium]|nr:shikimate kinase AroL [Pseudomonadota bacterium]MBU1695940.1 shikimate kinase AroL [Pseudomonadota bacterium]